MEMATAKNSTAANPVPDHAPSGIATWLIPEALRSERSFRFGIAVAGLMVLVALGKVAFSSPSEALFGAAALLGLMFVYVVFNRVTKTGPKVLHAPALALTWGMVVLFFLCAVATVSSAFFDYPKKFPALIADIEGKSTTGGTVKPNEASNALPSTRQSGQSSPPANPQTIPSLASPSVDRQSPVPVTIKVVYEPNFRSATRTMLTVKTADGKAVRDEIIPDHNGTASLALLPNKYVLSAIGGAQPIDFEALPPKTEVTIRVGRSISADQAVGDDPVQSETVTLDAGTSADAMNKKMFVSLVAIDFGGEPLRNRVTFVVGGRGIPSKTYALADVGKTCIAGPYQLRVATADTFKASFVITKR
jgi:hypothetical protein